MHLKVLWKCYSFPLAFRRTEEKLRPPSLLWSAAPWEYVTENTTSVGTVRCASVSSQWDCGWSIHLACRGLKGSGVLSDKKPVGTCSLCGSHGSGWATKFTAHVLSGWKGNVDTHALLGEAGWSNEKKSPGCYLIQFFLFFLNSATYWRQDLPLGVWASVSHYKMRVNLFIVKNTMRRRRCPQSSLDNVSKTRTHCIRGSCVRVSFKLIQVSCLYNTVCFILFLRQYMHVSRHTSFSSCLPCFLSPFL